MNAVRVHQNGNITTCEGLMHRDGDRLHLEYQIIDGILGVLKSGVKQVDIPIADLVSVDLARGWFGGLRIVLQARRMEAVQDVPGMSQGRVELLVARSDRDLARKLVDGLHKPSVDDGSGLEA
jgi:hypothetical protein